MVDLRKGLSDAWYSLTGGFESGFNRMLRGLSDSITTFNGNLIKSVSSNAAYYWKMYNGQTANYGETDGPSMGGYGPGWLAEQKKKNAAWKAAQAKLKNSADFKRGAGGMLASADKYGDAADQIPKPKTKTGWGVGTPPDLGGQSESDKVKERAAREQLRREKDAINDVAKAYEYKAQAAKKAAQITIEGAKNELEKLKDVRDSLKDKFGDLQSEFVSLGIINDPLGPMIKRFEQLIDVAGKSGKIVADARKSYNASFGAAKSASSMATGARSKSELLSGLDGVVPTKGGSLSNGSLPPFLKAMADKTGGTIGLQCGATITEFLHRAGIKGTATSIARSGNAKANADGTYAPGTIFNFKGGKGGYRVNHYATVAPDGQHWLESNWAGKGQRPNMITDKRLINWKRDIDAATWGGRRNIGQPSGVLAGKGGGFYRGTSNGASGGGSGDFPDFDLKVINGSLRKIGAIDSAWGKGVKSGEGTAARFSFQTALASKEYQDQLKAMAAQAGITFPQLVKMFRDFANKADIDLNRVKAVDAVTDSLKELDKTRRAIGSEKNPFASILGEFEAGGKYAGAPEKKLALLDSQRKLSVDQTTQATKEATRAEREKISVLSLAGRALNAYTIKTGQYEIALEKEQARFDVWKRPEVTNLLEEAKTYDKLGGSILKVGKALAANPFVSAPGASARMLTQGMGLKGRAAGLFANANKTAGTILDAQDKSSEYARAWGRTKADLEANDALDAQIIALKEEGSILKNLALSETERTDKIERSNFLLEKRSALLKLDHTSKDAERLAEGYAVKNDEIKRLTRRNEETKAYTSLLEESARAVKLAQGQTAITLKYPGYSPDTERKLALFEKTQALLGEFKDSGKKTFNDFDFFGKLKTFEKTFDAQAGLKNAGAVRSILDEAKQSALMFGDSSITAGIKFRTAFGDLSGEPDKVKRSLISATAQVQMFADANAALDAARTQSLDLSKQLEAQRMGRFRPLTSRQSQELDWKYSDLDAQMKNPGAIMDKKAQSVIQLQRDNVRGLLDSLTREAKIDTLTGKISDSFDNMFDSIIAKEKSAGAILRDGFQSTLTGLAGDFLKSQFRSLLGNLFTGVLGGGKTSGLLGNITPFAGGSISAGLASSGRGLFGGSGSGYGLKLDGSHAKGLDYVPKSPYYAELHRGETVLNSNEAARYRESRQAELIAGASSRSSGGGGNITVNYVHNGNVVANSPQEYQKKLQDQARRRGGSQRSLSQQREITQRFLGLK
ncbi:hypothetical protein EON83_25770 [bacterium]|nr:MAG: hypothetical protein EON83_25770 [bacterium]